MSFVSLESRPATTSGAVRWKAPDIAVIYHLTHGTFLSRPEAFKCDEQWEFVRSLCAFNPSERLGLAAAIEKLDLFARHEQFNAAGG
ncbi:hypothetical protein JG687_00001579 [Phytophthora cactorum]|uniref:Uncharacterized protein n=1 Tax=Phytophthora cactorum TaxID=29920 RepID=A0A8T1UXQ6_9STRA|nr:hypothetical protein JG687_00001579 [Phytophthora cactorum]